MLCGTTLARRLNIRDDRPQPLRRLDKRYFPDDTFDGIMAIGCFHHTGGLRRALEESHRLLKLGGKLIFMVYNVDS